jgi:preprotein translocase subunit YajC
MPLLLMGVIMYFLMIRPERKQQKVRKTMLEALKKNDQVLTIGGIHGTVASVGEDIVTLKVDEGKDLRIRVSRGAIQSILKPSKGGENGEKAGG